MLSLLLGHSAAQFIIGPVEHLGIAVTSVASSSTCGVRVFGTPSQAVQVERCLGCSLDQFIIGVPNGYQCAISEDESLMIMVGNAAWIKGYSAGTYTHLQATTVVPTTVCQQALLSSDKTHLFIRISGNQVQSYMGPILYTLTCTFNSFSGALRRIEIIQINGIVDILAFYGGTNFFDRYRASDAGYSAFALASTINIHSGSLLEVRASRNSRTVVIASTSGWIYVYKWVGGFGLFQRFVPTPLTLAINAIIIRLSPNEHILGVFALSDLMLYVRASTGNYLPLQYINNVPLATFHLCNDRLELYNNSMRHHYIACPSGYAHLGSCVPACPPGYGQIINVFGYCQLCLYDYQLSSCVSACPTGKFAGPVSSCQPCLLPCLTCTSNTTCLTCKGYVDGSACVQNCTYPKANDYTSGTCVTCVGYYLLAYHLCFFTCPPQTYAISSFCVACLSPCHLCLGPSNCLSCAQPYFYHSNSCLSTCPVGMKPDLLKNCIDCPPGCASCGKTCTSCSGSLFLLENQCLTSCPTSHFNLSQECFDLATQSIQVSAVKVNGFFFPSSDKNITFSFSQDVTLADFQLKFSVIDHSFAAIQLNSTTIRLTKACGEQVILSASLSIYSNDSASVASSGRPYGSSLSGYRSSYTYGCLPTDQVSRLLFQNAEPFIYQIYNSSQLLRSGLGLLLPAQFPAVLPALRANTPLPSVLLILQNVVGAPLQESLQTWHGNIRRLLVNQGDFPVRPVIFTAALLLSLTVFAVSLHLQFSLQAKAVLSLAIQRGLQLCYFVLLAEVAGSTSAGGLAASIAGLVLCLCVLGISLFRKACFLNSALTSAQFWRFYPQFAVWTLLLKFRVLTFNKLSLSLICGPQFYNYLVLLLKSTLAASAMLLTDFPPARLAVSLSLLTLFTALTVTADPYEGRALSAILVAKDSAYFLIFVTAAAMHICFSSSIAGYLALGWVTALLLLLYFVAELSFCLYLYLLAASAAHRDRTTAKVTQYYERLIAEGQLSEKQINALVVDGNLNRAVDQENLPDESLVVCQIKLQRGQSLVEQVESVRINPLWMRLSTTNFKVVKLRRELLAKEDEQRLWEYVGRRYGEFEEALLEVHGLVRQSQHRPGEEVAAFELSSCVLRVSSGGTLRHFSQKPVPAIIGSRIQVRSDRE